jgi:uncharacterized protein YggE
MIRSTLVITMVFCSVGFAQFPELGGQAGTITGTGTSTITVQPDRMRLSIDVLSRGSGLKPALAGLKKLKATASAKLVALGADKDSIKFKSPRITSQQSAEQRQMIEMMKQRLNARRAGGDSKKAKKKQADPVVVSVSLTAEWKLEGTSEEVLVKTHELQKLIREADISASKKAASLSPEEQELLEEAQQQYGGYRSEEKSPGEPAFAFVSTVPEDSRDKAMAEAFQKAKKQATRLAAAAGSKPGPLSSLLGSASSSGEDDEYGRYRRMYGGGGGSSSSSDESEAVGAKYGPLSYVVTVVAGFKIVTK